MTDGDSRGTWSGSDVVGPPPDWPPDAPPDDRDAPRPASDNAGRVPLTDGGRDGDESGTGANHQEEFESPDADEDPFVWPDADERADDEGQSADDGRTEASGRQVEDGPARTGGPDDNREPDDGRSNAGGLADLDDPGRWRRSGAATAATGRSTSDVDSLGEGLEVIERRLDRLDTVAEDLNVAAINAGLKQARGEESDLERIHDEIETYAERVDEEVERLSSVLESLQDVRQASESTQLAGPRGSGRALAQRGTPAVTVRAGWEEPGERSDRERRIRLGVGGDTGNGTTPAVAPDVDPVEFLIPGAELRDMWRARMRTEQGGSIRDGERWILETTPREDRETETLEFPPEVTEFTLDPDELSFADVLDLVEDDP